MAGTAAWEIPGSRGEMILGNVHRPIGAPRGTIILAHGAKGYKDYGMFPCLACAMAAAGFFAHRFNFSHSGMTNRIETFERPDLFERNTWNREVEDLALITGAVADGTLEGARLPLVLFGHSRGGISVLLAAGRGAVPMPAGIVTAGAPSRCLVSDKDRAQLLAQGYCESPSARTGQVLREGRAALQEQIEDPEGYDLLRVAAKITCPVLVLHGRADRPDCARRLRKAIGARARRRSIWRANHTFNTPNPMPADARPGRALRAVIRHMLAFANRVCAVPADA